MCVVEEDMTLVHATPEDPEAWNYITTMADIRRCFNGLRTPIGFIGHSHVPVVYIQDASGAIRIEDAEDVMIDSQSKTLINVGSVGQPRDGDPRAAFGILDSEKHQFLLKRVAYPIETVQEDMSQKGLPLLLIYRLSMGW